MGSHSASSTSRSSSATPALGPPLAVDPREEQLRAALAELALADLWRRDHDNDFTPLGNASGPLARWQGRVVGREADADATGRQVLSLWDMIQHPSTKAGRFARAHFADALVEYCASTSRSTERDDVDWTRARSLAECLAEVSSAERSVLSTLMRECAPTSTWTEAARIVADAHAPPALRAAWSLAAGPGAPGRPRRDPTRPPPDAERAAWGSDVLAAALGAWQRARSASA